MQEEYAVRRSPSLLRLHLGDHLIQAFGEGEAATVQSAVALLRTLFEDHYVDPEHQACSFFHGCTLVGFQSKCHDFTVVHRGDRVVLSDFTFQQDGPAYVSLPLATYAAEVVRFAAWVLAMRSQPRKWPEWQRRHMESQWTYLEELANLGQRFLASGCLEYQAHCDEYHALHGQFKRPLELQVLEVLEQGGHREPIAVRARVSFGPLGAKEVLPMRLNRGDVILVTVNQFSNRGVLLTLEGVGSGGIRPGDKLFGIQLFYP